ncbi:MAG: hypothetical protein ACSLFJ_02335 [Immundisolibacter sp.]
MNAPARAHPRELAGLPTGGAGARTRVTVRQMRDGTRRIAHRNADL